MNKLRALWLILKIWRWHDKLFADWNFDQQKGKFSKEVYEFVTAMESYTSSNNDGRKLGNVYKEMADVIISGLNLLKYYQGISTVEYKFKEVKRRKYGKDGQHKA